MCGLLQCSLHGQRDAAQNWEEEVASTPSDDKVASTANTSWQPCTGRHHDQWSTIGGGILQQIISRMYEIKKQVTGEDRDLQKSGRILNRVIEVGS